MPIQLECPHCHTKFGAGLNMDESKMRCPVCMKTLSAPGTPTASSKNDPSEDPPGSPDVSDA